MPGFPPMAMVVPPTTFCKECDIAARPGTEPSIVASEVVRLADGGSLRLTELRWDLAQFDFSDPEMAKAVVPGCIHTFVVTLQNVELHLEQHDSAFWTSSALGARSVDRLPGPAVRPAPRWRKRSDRFWPQVGGIPVPFIGQTHMAGGDIYLFRLATGAMLAHRVDRFAQDAEDHYDDEERRGDS